MSNTCRCLFIVAGSQTICGDRSPHKVEISIHIADALTLLHRHQDAKEQYEKVLPIADAVFGSTHEKVLHLKTNLANTVRWSGHSFYVPPSFSPGQFKTVSSLKHAGR
jgi:hypothetical protein